MIKTLRASFMGAMLVFAGCAEGRDTEFSSASETRSLADRLSGQRPEPTPTPHLTPEMIAELKTPTLEVALERSGARALLSPYSDRPDLGSGLVRVWRSADGSQIVLRNGVLIATRGLGSDLESVRSNAMIRAIAGHAPVSFQHRLFVLTGGTDTERIDLGCDMQRAGVERIAIVDQSINTVHLRADCRFGVQPVTYDFWVDPQRSTIWQSRQWAGPSLGYIRMRKLKN